MGDFLDKITKRLAAAKGSSLVNGKTMTGEQPNQILINPDISMKTEHNFNSFKDFIILEYLTPSQREKFADVKMTARARKDTDHFFGENNDQKREEIPGQENDNKSEVHKAIERHIGKPITKEEYHAGKISDKYGREAKLGKFIKDPKLQQAFNADNTRSGAKKGTNGHYSTIVRGTEVAGQTNSEPDELHPKGHSWGQQSCKNLTNGVNNHYLDPEIRHGTVVHRVHDETGKEIYRATLHPHHNSKGQVAYAVDSEYGIKHPDYTAHAHDIAKRLSDPNGDTSGLYRKHDEVYDDSGRETMLHPNMSSEDIGKLLKDDDTNYEVKAAAAQHPNATSEHLDYALDDPTGEVRQAAIQNPNLTSKQIDKALKDKNTYVRIYAAGHPNATEEHIDKALNDDNSDVRSNALSSPKVTEEHLNKALDDRDSYVSLKAAQHPNATSANIHKALSSPYAVVRSRAASHPKASSENLHKALNDTLGTVRFNALLNPNATKEHVEKAKNDKDVTVRQYANKHPLAKDSSGENDSNKATAPTKWAESVDPELHDRHHVMFFGRANPPHSGHEKAYNVVKNLARKFGGTSSMLLSRTQDKKKNPLTPEQKERHAKRAFPDVNTSVVDASHPTILHQLSKLHQNGVTHLHVVAGSDRQDDYDKLLHQYNGVEGPHGYYNFKNIQVHSSGERDPDAEGTEGMSASKMRLHAQNNDKKSFMAGAPSSMKPEHREEMFNDLRAGMAGPPKKTVKEASVGCNVCGRIGCKVHKKA